MAKDRNPTGLHPSKGKFIWKLFLESWKRAATPIIMYMFMSMILTATQSLLTTRWIAIAVGSLCVVAALAFNAHLAYQCGAAHYGTLVTGNLHRRNEAAGMPSGKDHKLECEYRLWKGFLIGFLVGVPVIILGSVAGAMHNIGYGDSTGAGVASLIILTLAGWAIAPVLWIGIDPYYSLLFILLPIIVTGVFYIVGAIVDRGKREAQAERDAAVKKLEEEQRLARLNRVQTEEQKKKTLQSKKKK